MLQRHKLDIEASDLQWSDRPENVRRTQGRRRLARDNGRSRSSHLIHPISVQARCSSPYRQAQGQPPLPNRILRSHDSGGPDWLREDYADTSVFRASRMVCGGQSHCCYSSESYHIYRRMPLILVISLDE